MSVPITPAFDRARDVQAQQAHGLSISPSIFPALLHALCAEMEGILGELVVLREQVASRSGKDPKAAAK